ncbi:MAG TPA: class I SAM-dependent methyltransferase [Polyangiaceae bacterium]|nr:class I SAM-dependent methyltransferase [Polyangiaceae bacterium]
MEAARTNDEQAALWNGVSGQSWVEAQGVLDRMFMPFESLLVELSANASPERVLDVGCGTGSTTLAIQKKLGAQCQCLGIDISDPMLVRARARAQEAGSPASFLRADAEQYAFEPGSFDLIVSRFGVMFFADSVRAFTNLKLAARPGARLCVIAWRSAAENPFMTAAERAVASMLPSLPAREPGAPGQFRFADSSLVQGILEQSAWSNIDIRALDLECTFPEQELLLYATRVGPLGRVLPTLDEPGRARILAAARPAFEPYVQGATVRFRAACWKITARA